MIDAVLDAVAQVLVERGISAFREFPKRAPRRGSVCVTVGARDVKCVGSGLGDYLGVRTKEDGSSVELFGKKLELEVVFEVFAPFESADGAGDCVRCADEVLSLTGVFPSGIKLLEISGGEVSADEELRFFRCQRFVRCAAFFVAEAAEGDEAEFLDFVLKGVVEGVS